MPSLETLARAANSLDMERFREGASLKVLVAGSSLTFSIEHGRLTHRHRSGFAWMPQWLVRTVGVLGLVFVGLNTRGHEMVLNAFILTLMALSFVSVFLKTVRAKERLFDRAYDMEISGLRNSHLTGP